MSLPRATSTSRPSTTVKYSHDAFTDSVAANRKALRAMTEAQRLSGKTVEQLAAEQAELKAAFYKRRAA